MVKSKNPVKQPDVTLTSDLGGEVGGVAGYEELKLLVQVAVPEVHVPGSNSCQKNKSEWQKPHSDTKDTCTANGVSPVRMTCTTLPTIVLLLGGACLLDSNPPISV